MIYRSTRGYGDKYQAVCRLDAKSDSTSTAQMSPSAKAVTTRQRDITYAKRVSLTGSNFAPACAAIIATRDRGWGDGVDGGILGGVDGVCWGVGRGGGG